MAFCSQRAVFHHPSSDLKPDVHPGNCWAFRGSRGFVAIRLSMPIFPTAVTLEHTPRALSPSGKMHSAPRDFSIYVSAEPTLTEQHRLLSAAR